MSLQEKMLEKAGVITELTAATQALLNQEKLPENPYAALAASTRHLSSAYRAWSAKASDRGLVLNEVKSSKQDQELCHAAGTFELWGLANLVRMIDTRCVKGLVKMVSDRISVNGGQEIEGDFTLRHVLAIGGDWIYAQHIAAFPHEILLYADYAVTGPTLEAGLDMFVLRVLEDVATLSSPEQGNFVDGFYIETARKDDFATVSAEVSKDVNGPSGFFKFGVDKRRREAQLALDQASENTPIHPIKSEKWSIESMRASKQSFIAKVKDAVIGRRRIWLSFYGLVADSPAHVSTTGAHDSADHVDSFSDLQAEVGKKEDKLTDTTMKVGNNNRFCKWLKYFTFHFQGNDDDMKNFCTHAHETLFRALFFSRHDAEFYKSLFHHSYGSVLESRQSRNSATGDISRSFHTRILRHIKEKAIEGDGFTMLSSALHLLALGYRSADEIRQLLPNLCTLLHSGAFEYHLLASEASMLSKMFQIISDEHDNSESFVLQGRMALLACNVREFRRRFLRALSKYRHHSCNVSHGTSMMVSILSQLYDKQEGKLLTTAQDTDFTKQRELLLRVYVFCQAVAYSELDALLESSDCESVLCLLLACYEDASSHSHRPPSPSRFSGLYDQLHETHQHLLNRINSEAPYIVRPSWARRKVACRAYIDLKAQQELIVSQHHMPPAISKEAVYLQYASDTGLDRFLAETITNLTWNSIPHNWYKIVSDQINYHLLHFDSFHRPDEAVLAGALQESVTLTPWIDSGIFYADQTAQLNLDASSAHADAHYLFVAECNGKVVLGSRLALAVAPIRSDLFWSLRDSLEGLLIDERYTTNAFTVDTCTGVSGIATSAGGIAPSSAISLTTRLTQDVCIEGPNPIDAASLFVRICAEHVVDLLQNRRTIYVQKIGGESDVSSLVDVRDLVGADVRDRVASVLEDSLQVSQGIRLEGFFVRCGIYAPFCKHIALHYGDLIDGPIKFTTHRWPNYCHLNERVYFSAISAPGFFSRCQSGNPLRERVPQDRSWLEERSKQEFARLAVVLGSYSLASYFSMCGRQMLNDFDSDLHVSVDIAAANLPNRAGGTADAVLCDGVVSAVIDAPLLDETADALQQADTLQPQAEPMSEPGTRQHVESNGFDSVYSSRKDKNAIFVECCRVLNSAVFHLSTIQMRVGTVRALACELNGQMTSKVDSKIVARQFVQLADQLRQYCSSEIGRSVYYHGCRPLLLRKLDTVQKMLLKSDSSDLLNIDETIKNQIYHQLLYIENFVQLIYCATARDMLQVCPRLIQPNFGL